MGAVSWLLGQAAITSVTLGYLKHKHIIQCDALGSDPTPTEQLMIAT